MPLLWEIGGSSRLLWDLETFEAASLLQKIGYTHFELWAEWPKGWPRSMSREDRSRLRRLLTNLGLGISVHATFRDLNLSSPNPGIREESVRQVVESVQLAADLDADIVVVHPGRLASPRDDPREAWDLLVKSLGVVVREAEGLGLKVCIENMSARPKEIVRTPGDLRRLFEEVGSKSLMVTLDAAHAGTVGDPVEFVLSLSDLVAHVHLSDYSREKLHLPLGRGELDLPRFLRALRDVGYAGVLVVEGYFPPRTKEVALESYRALVKALSEER